MLPNVTKEDDITGDQGLHVIISDTGRELHVFRNAKAVWTDHRGKEYTAHAITSEGEEKAFYCGQVCYCAPETGLEDDAPSAKEILNQHSQEYGRHSHNWGHIE